jgi:hypothetical protein
MKLGNRLDNSISQSVNEFIYTSLNQVCNELTSVSVFNRISNSLWTSVSHIIYPVSFSITIRFRTKIFLS